MIEHLNGLSDKTVGFKRSGKRHDEEHKKFVPLVYAVLQRTAPVDDVSLATSRT